MNDHDLDRLMNDYYGEQDRDAAPERLVERIESIPQLERDPSYTPHRWRWRLGRWLGRDDDGLRHADIQGPPRRTNDGRNRLMITMTAAAAVMALAFGLTVGPLGLIQTTQAPASEADGANASIAFPETAMRGGPVTVTACFAGVVDEGTELDGIDHTVGRTEMSEWESSGSLYGEDEPRLAGTATRVTNLSYGTFDDLRDIELEQHAFTVVNDAGSWEGSSTTFVRGREPGRSTEVLLLEGRDGYQGLTAMLQFPVIDEEMGTYPECYELFGVIVEGGKLPAPEPFAGDSGTVETLDYPIGTAFMDGAFMSFEETGFALAPGTWTVEIMNMGEVERAFVIEAPMGEVVAGSPDELVPSGEAWVQELTVDGSGEGYVLYDPADRAGTEVSIPAQE